MKKLTIPFCVLAIAGLISCGGADTSEGTNVDSVTSTTTSSENVSTESGSGQTVILETTKYVDLTSGSQVSVKKDEKTGYYINAETQNQVEYFFDPATNDTFDMHGHIVNMALSKSAEGKYITDEAKVKVQGDGDVKIKDETTDTKIKLDADGETKIKTNGAKEKTDGDDYKYKDDSTKIKVRDGKLKVKN